MSRDTAALSSLALVRARIERIPDLLRQTLALDLHASESGAGLADDVLVTGIGASTGVARVLATLLAERLARRARFVPLGAFAGEPPAGGALVVVTQGASPNARLALRAIPRYARALVLTSTAPASHGPGQLIAEAAARGSAVVVVPPEAEDGALLRVMGPATASLAAIALVEQWRRAAGQDSLCDVLAAVPALLESAALRAFDACRDVPVTALDGPCAFVTLGRDPALLQGFQWKWLEGLRVPEPFGWDLLEIAHGPLQAAAERPLPFVLFAPEKAAATADLVTRLRSVLGPIGCPLVVLTSALPWPLSLLDHDAQLNALLLRILEERPRDLGATGRWDDRALYGLGREEDGSENGGSMSQGSGSYGSGNGGSGNGGSGNGGSGNGGSGNGGSGNGGSEH